MQKLKPCIKSLSVLIFIFVIVVIHFQCAPQKTEGPEAMGLGKDIQQKCIKEMINTFGEAARERIETGVAQAASRWKKSDGSAEDFQKFCLKHFTIDSSELKVIFERFQHNLEMLFGHLHIISREFDWALQVDIGPVYDVDYLFANYNPFAHVSEDFFHTKLAFVALLNFPLETLENKNNQGLNWSRKKWAETRLVEQFQSRIPSEVAQKRSEAYTAADDYISNYNIFMHQLLDEQGNRLFPQDLKLITHWGLRDELKAQYANPEGFPRQHMIQAVMEKIIRQEIPRGVINSREYDWNPFENTVYKAGTRETVKAEAEPNTRYQHIWNIFQAERGLDPYYPQAPSLIDRRFQIMREMSEAEVEGLLIEVLSSPILKDIASLIQKRLGRPLEPFDIWYNGFKLRSKLNEDQLDKIVSQRYPTVDAFQRDLPFILRNLGFSPQTANFLAEHIQVDPSRGAGHASGAMMKADRAHLRTRIPETGMTYKGYNIAIHELGHNVEQVFSLNGIDYYTLNGVPNTAFTEAFAFVFQSRDLEILGLGQTSQQDEDLRALNDMWATMEISGVALTDMYIWRWMYDHPDANPEMLREAMLQTAKSVWNQYFAPVLGHPDTDLLAIYSHIVDGGMYTPDYPLGHIISFQIEQYLKEHPLAPEMERMCKLGRLSPQIWMQLAVGEKVSAQPLIQSAARALQNVSN
ncbi:MAG: hypothetical protein Kow0042_19440 [Calditrichia bacterium]